MRIHQAGNYSERVSANQINDWSWAQTMRRVRFSPASPRPTDGACSAGVATLLVGTAAALAPPYLAKLAIDEGILGNDDPGARDRCGRVRRGRRGRLARGHGTDVPHELGRRAGAGRPAAAALPPSRPPLARLLRAQPHGCDRLAAHERRRGAGPAGHGRGHEPRPELPRSRRLGDHPRPARLAPRARHARRVPVDGGRHGDLPPALDARVSPRPRAARPGHRHAAGGHLRDAGRPGLRARAEGRRALPRSEHQLPRGQPRDRRPQQRLFPVRRPAGDGGHRGRPRARKLPGLRRLPDDRNPVRVHRLPDELLRPGPAALPALQHLPRGRRGARQDHRPDGGGARDRGPARRSAPLPRARAASASTPSASATATGPRSCTASTSRSPPAPPSPWSATPAQGNRRSPSCLPASTTRARAVSRSTTTISAT